jgi:hypothetical protein
MILADTSNLPLYVTSAVTAGLGIANVMRDRRRDRLEDERRRADGSDWGSR